MGTYQFTSPLTILRIHLHCIASPHQLCCDVYYRPVQSSPYIISVAL